MERSLRIVFATIVVLVAMMVLQVPNAAFALYVIFIVSNENPAAELTPGCRIARGRGAGALDFIGCRDFDR